MIGRAFPMKMLFSRVLLCSLALFFSCVDLRLNAQQPGGATAGGQGPMAVQSYMVVDFYTRKIISAHNPNVRRQVASLTKIATAMVVLDWMDAAQGNAGQMIVVPPSAATAGGANPLGLQPGDQISIRDALYGAIAGSDNVCALALANHVGRDLIVRAGGADPVAEFVKQMNYLAEKQGCENTRFTNPHGLDSVQSPPYSTAADIARLSIYAMSKGSYTFYASQESRKLTVLRGAQKQRFMMKNTNKLLGKAKIDGIKTGLTSRAGACVAISAARPSTARKGADGKEYVTHHRLVVVVLGAQSPDARFTAAESLLIRGWQKYDEWNAAGRQFQDTSEMLSGPPAGR
jgi:D-alanyl-D-alanine carboxypeptidase (penicillin-binding protein 5/6)